MKRLLLLLLVALLAAGLAGCNAGPAPATANDWTAPIAWEIAHATITTPAPAPTPTPPTPSPDNGSGPGSPAANADRVPPLELAAAPCPSGRCPVALLPTVKTPARAAEKRPPAADCPSCLDRPRLTRPRTWGLFRRR